MGRFTELKSVPNFNKYEKNNATQINERNKMITDDVNASIATIKDNVTYYVQDVNTLLTKVINHEITSMEHTVFKKMYNTFGMIVNQFIAMENRYDNVEELPKEVKPFVHDTLVKLADFYKLGIYDSNECRNHADVVEDMASLIMGSDVEVDLDKVYEGIEDLHRIEREVREENQKRAEQAKQATKTSEEGSYGFTTSKITFKDVAGLHEVKEDLMQYVDMIQRPQIYKQYGARLPKGVIFYGPPGTGKTHLSRALAGEAKVKFIATAATDFTASTWGKTPEKIKALFAQARANAPCIVFIDEIDMLGMNRGMDTANGLAHREHLNALLAEMDGFEQYDGVMIIAATNRLEDLDPALTRAGRFDNQFSIPLPDSVDEVEEVVKIYMKGKHFGPDVNSRAIAHKLIGNSPASIEGLMNEACLIAIRKNGGFIRMSDIDEAYIKKAVKGHVRNNQDVSQEEREVVAYHEAGHALVAVIQERKIQSVTILGTTTGAGGLTVSEPLNKHLLRKSDFEKQIRISYGGRAAEEVIFGEDMITTGASADIRKCTHLIGDAASSYGFDLLDSKNPVPKIKYNDAKNVKETIEKASIRYYDETVKLIRENIDALKAIANALLENGTISGDKVQELYEKNSNKEIEMI